MTAVVFTLIGPTDNDVQQVGVIGSPGASWHLGSFASDAAAQTHATNLGITIEDGHSFYLTTTDKVRMRTNGAWADLDAGALAAQAAAATSAADAASSALALGASSRFSYIPNKNSDANSDITFISRANLSETPIADVALATSANYQLLISSFTNPGTRVTGSVVSSKLRLTSNLAANFFGGAATLYRAYSGRTITGGGRTITVAGTLSSIGFGPIFTTAQPTGGGATAVMDSAAIGISIRANGSVTAYERNGTTVASGVTIGTPTTTAWAAGQYVTWSYKATSSTGGTLNVYADGALIGSYTLSGLPADAYVMNGVRFALTDVIEFVDMSVSEASFDTHRRIWLDPNNAGVAVGTEANPFTTLKQVVEAFDVDTYRREVSLILKAGVYRGTLAFDARRWRRIRVQSAKGHGAIIRPSSALSGGVWTQIGASEVWHAPNVWGAVSGSTLGFGGLVETTSGITQTFGRTGLVSVSGRKLYTRRSVGTSDASLGRGDYTVHQTSTYAGKVLVRCYDGGDPNAKTWEQMAYNYGISCIGAANADANACSLEVSDLIVEHPMTHGFYGKWINAIVENVAVKGTGSGFGFEFDECNLRAMGCLVEGSYADCYHSAGGASADTNRRLPAHIYDDCDGMGAFTDSQGSVGDGWSNHAGNVYFLNNCRAWSSGKDGLSSIDEFRLSNFDARDHVNAGVSLAASTSDRTLKNSMLSGGRCVGNDKGVMLNLGAQNNVTASIDCQGVIVEDSVRSSFETFSSGAGCSGAINAWNCSTITTGVAPTQGHKKISGLTINVKSGVALT